jgi:5'-nucleotidase
MPLVLLTNDDGIGADGLRHLHEALAGIGDVYVVAPDRERSAAGHSLTIHRPLRLRDHGNRVFSLSGTPTDCVAIGIEKVLPGKPDLVVSGINHGPNLGDDITYSGTVAAAFEGTIMNIPSIAVSIDGWNARPWFFETAAEVARTLAEHVLLNSLPFDTLLNVNVPNVRSGELRGIKFTRQGKRIYEGAVRETSSPWGETFFWIGGGRPLWEHGEDTDMHAVQEGFVSVTPLHMDLTNHGAIPLLLDQWRLPSSTR